MLAFTHILLLLRGVKKKQRFSPRSLKLPTQKHTCEHRSWMIKLGIDQSLSSTELDAVRQVTTQTTGA